MMDVARIIHLQNECLYVSIERYLCRPGSLEASQNEVLRCGFCPFCRKEQKPTPAVVRNGLTTVLFNIFNPPPSNVNISTGDKPWTVDVLVERVRSFENAADLILRSRSKSGLRPDTVKRIVFGLLACGILQLNYHNVIKKAVFSLARSTTQDGAFALSDDRCWGQLDLK